MRDSPMPAPESIVQLVDHFTQHMDAYRSGKYNEAQLRNEYLNPFFEAMGWDMTNKQNYSESYKEVLLEESVEVEGGAKAPDYTFRIGGKRIFFVEAKKPSVNIKFDIHPAFQVRRYAWSAKLPVCILTDFEEFAVYESLKMPHPNEQAATGRILFFTFNDYVKKWDEIAGIFSREAVLKGSFDKFEQSVRGKHGTLEVDDAFLKEIESWREMLAKNLAIRNLTLSNPELNYAVQIVINRIVFLRICEDRGIERDGQLQDLIKTEGIYDQLCVLFKQADQRYNSGLFHFINEKDQSSQPDDLSPRLKLDDRVLKELLKSLYYPSPYVFKLIPTEILGQVYERFLGKVIHLTAGHQARVEEKPEVRKAGGVYYTPTYIVDYIVKNTIGSLLEKKTPKNSNELKILDPACGSGSFLLGAYQYLLNWHIDWYIKNEPQKWAKGANPAIYQTKVGDWKLTTFQKKRILLNNIHGVDIDPQAVEVTKLSLLLKVLEDESQESIGQQLNLLKERALPDLGKNIQCGNSLIGPNFSASMLFADEKEQVRVNPFDWHIAFPQVFAQGGFDVVIGNPPWGADFEKEDKEYLEKFYSLNTGKYESYIYFIEIGIRVLAKSGFFGFIIPSYWVSRSQTEALRRKLSEQLIPFVFIILPENVFSRVKMDSCIIIAKNKIMNYEEEHKIKIGEISTKTLGTGLSINGINTLLHEVNVKQWLVNPYLRFNPRILNKDLSIMEKVQKNTVVLGELVAISQGLTLYRLSTLTEKFGKTKANEIVENRLFHSNIKENDTYKKELLGKDIARYFVRWNGKSWISYGSWLAHAVDEKYFHGPRLVIQKIRNPMLHQRLVVGYLDDNETYSAGVLLNAIPINMQYSLFYLMGLLNSKLINFWYRKNILDVSIRVIDLRKVPIHKINFLITTDISQHDRLVLYSKHMSELMIRISHTPQEKEAIQREMVSNDKQIDQLVYELYGLTEEEINIIEKGDN